MTTLAVVSATRTALHRDPRRPGRTMVAVWCVCGRFYTVTAEQVVKRRHTCPDADCGKGSE